MKQTGLHLEHSIYPRPTRVLPSRVPVEALRKAVERSGLTASEVAQRLEWRRPNNAADCQRVRRVLGLEAQAQGKGYGYKPRTHVNRATADRLLAVLVSER